MPVRFPRTFMIPLFIVGFLFAALLAVLYSRTLMVQNLPEQQTFAAGHVPSPLPDGMLRGSVPGHKGAPGGWLGKKFNAKNGTGINVLQAGATTEEKYIFRTYTGTGLRDNIQVYKIDYDIARNPWWLRRVMDEIVEVSPGRYLGKLHLRIVPGVPFTLAYFWLER